MVQSNIFHNKRNKLQKICSATVFAIGVAVLFGWLLDITILKVAIYGYPTMKPTTALLLVVMAYVLFRISPTVRGRRRIAPLLATLVVLTVALTDLVEQIMDVRGGMDELILSFFSLGSVSVGPGLMSPQSALNFILLSIGLLLLDRGKRASIASESLTLAALAFTLAAILGHLYGASQLGGTDQFNTIAVHATFCFLLLGVGMLAANVGSRLVRLFTSETLGGMAARRLMTAAILVPMSIGFLSVLGQSIDLYDAGVGASLTILASIVSLFGASYYFSSMVHSADLRRRAAEQRIAESEERFREIFDYSQGVICTHDLDGVITSVNPATVNSVGFKPEEIIGQNLRNFIPSTYRPEFDAYLRKVVNEGEDKGLLSVISKSGKPIVWRYHNVLVFENGEPSYVLGHGQDVTEILQMKAELEKLSLKDELTNLYNRRGFMTLAEQQLRLEEHSGTARGLELLFVDMDGLKTINDTYGHEAGSEAIRKIADILRSSLRRADIIARWGGDEFVILAIGSKDEDEMLEQRIYEKLDLFNEQSGLPYKLGCSIGSTRIDLKGPRTLDEVIADADEAMYKVKRRRKARRRGTSGRLPLTRGKSAGAVSQVL